MSLNVFSISALPNIPAVYAMYSGKGSNSYVAYIGIADKLKQRINQHLVRQDSSIVTGASAVSLNPNLITEIRWWHHENFTDRSALEAAELIAFEIFEPVLRSRGAVTERAILLSNDPSFVQVAKALFLGEHTGILKIHSLQSALEQIAELEKRVKQLEKIVSDRSHL